MPEIAAYLPGPRYPDQPIVPSLVVVSPLAQAGLYFPGLSRRQVTSSYLSYSTLASLSTSVLAR